jgi:hypothetical protein
MEIPGIEPSLTIRKIVVLPVKLYPLKVSYLFVLHPLSEERLERSWFTSTKLKIVLSTNSSTRIYDNNIILNINYPSLIS